MAELVNVADAIPGDTDLAVSTACQQVVADRFEIVRQLKTGQGIETLLGRDRSTSGEVIVKSVLATSLSTGARMRLEHEAEVLRRLDSPAFAPLLHLGWEDSRLWLVMAFVPGRTLAERLAEGALSVRDSLTVGTCLMKALQQAHDHGVLHRDLKPANIIVSDEPPLRATLIDFGLSRSVQLDASIRDQPVGTARYISPEQAGLLDRGVDERSDLYSAGVVLFECLAGRPPFQSNTLGEVLRQHLMARPPELRSLGLAVPRALDEVIQRLLRKDPRDRYQCAEAVATDLAAIEAALARGVAEPDIVVGVSDKRRALTEPAFVGRASELAALDVALAQARTGLGGLVLLEAESGGGKSRLLAELAQRGARRGAWVLRGQGQNQAAQRPFQVLVGIADALLAAVNLEPGFAATIRERLGDHGPAVCAALPELADTLGIETLEGLGPEKFGETRTLEALVRLLSVLGSRERPALVLLDDCQWADELTLKLLQRWQQQRSEVESGNRYALVVVAFRSEEVTADHRLRALNPTTRVVLSAFTSSDVRQLAESMAGPLPTEALDVAVQLAHGSPFMAAAVLQGMVESGALVAEPDGWRAEPLALQSIQSSRHAAAFLARRVALLPPGIATLLAAGAVLGKEFDLSLAAILAGQAPSAAIVAIDESRRRHMVWANDTRCVFVHDKLRQTFLEQLPGAQRKDLHHRAALLLQNQPERSPFDLAYHFDAAGHSDLALPFALEAAEQARAQHALESAEQQYKIAERGLVRADNATRLRVALGLGDVYMLRGHYREAAAQFENARGLTRGDREQARLEGRLGELAFKCGDVETARPSLERALRLLGRLVPQRFTLLVLLVVWEVLVQVIHSLLPRFFLARRPLDGADDERLGMRLYSRLAHLYWFHRGTLPCLWAHLRGMNRAELFPPTPELAQAWSEHAPVMSLVPNFRRGIAYAQRSLAIRRDLGDLWGQGQSLNFYGVILYASSRFEECITKCRESVRLLERTGDHWEVHIARFQIAASLYRLGDLQGALAEAHHIHQRGLELGDTQASGLSLDIWARATGGRIPAELIETELSRPRSDVQRTAQIMLAEGVRRLAAGQPAGAAAILEEARDLLHQSGIRNAWVAPVLPWLATAWRQAALQAASLTPGRRHEWLRRALKAARQSLRRTRCFPNELPHTLRELGLISAMLGRRRRAARYFRASLDVARQQGARYEEAQTRFARAEIGIEFGWPDAAEELKTAGQEIEQLTSAVVEQSDEPAVEVERPATLSLADRFDSLLEVGRHITTALSREAIVAAVQEAAVRLLRGEYCVVHDLKDSAAGQMMPGDNSSVSCSYGRVLIDRAVGTGRATAAVSGVPDAAGESLLLAGVRSILCAPIFVWGQPAACLWVTHHEVSGLFGPDEERLADFVASLAGAALENAEGFAELRRLNTTLQHEVTERQQAEKRVHEQAALLDKAQDAIMVLDANDAILFWNPSAARLYGWRAEEAIGKNAAELLFRKGGPRTEQALRIVQEKGEWAGELSQVTRDQKDLIVESRWTLVRDEDGSPKSRLIVNTDVTEKRRLEANLLRAQRTESLGTLAGGIAHDINNILTPIVMGIDILKSGLPGSPLQPLLADMETSAQRGTEMVRQILSFARGGGEGQKTNLRLKQVLSDIEKMVRRTFPKTITTRTRVEPDLSPVWGDSTQLYQTLMNLCVNARDAMPEGGMLTVEAANVQVDAETARIHPDAQPGPHVLLSVTDTGTGIPPQVLERIFDPFFTTKEQGKGTGLGLATVLGIVKGHGGFLNVTSEVGVGTCFSVYLPAVPASQAEKTESQVAPWPTGQGETILVVDDEPRICQLTKQTLESHGYRVLTAANGAEALALYARHQDDIQAVLTDLMMPVMDGTATIQALRNLDPGVRIIATSGLTPARKPTEMFPDNVYAFLAKPFTMADLMTTLHTVLHEPAQSEAQPALA